MFASHGYFHQNKDIDTSNPIKYKMIIPLWLSLSAKSTKMMKLKAIADMNFMTAFESNARYIMEEKTFQSWIFDILYSVFPPRSNSEKDPIWDMGWKLYLEISKMWFSTYSEAHKYTHYLVSWPLKKIVLNKSNSKEDKKHSIKKKERMVRTLLYSFLDTLSVDKERQKYPLPSNGSSNNKIFWTNLVSVLFYVEELVLTYSGSDKSHESEISMSLPKSNANFTYIQEIRASLLETNQNASIFSIIKNGLYYTSKNQWQDARLLDKVFRKLEPIWLFKIKRRSNKSKTSFNSKTLNGYIQIEDAVLDRLEELSPGEANDRLELLLYKKRYLNESIPHKKDTHKFYFLKSLITLICIRITMEDDKDLAKTNCKIIRDLGESIIYISENWVTHKADENKSIQQKLSIGLGYIIYFLCKEIRRRDESIKHYLKEALNSIMSTIFVIVLK